MISFVRHSPSRGHFAFFGQLYDFAVSGIWVRPNFLLSLLLITDLTLDIQLYEILIEFLFRILYNLCVGGKHLSIVFRNSLPMYVLTP